MMSLKPKSSKGKSSPDTKVAENRREQAFTYHEDFVFGEGGFGKVYDGHRDPDGMAVSHKVAIKHIPLARVPMGKHERVPLEVFLMQKAAGGNHSGGSTAAISLLDWQVKGDELILILERPFPCSDLFDYVERKGGFLEEKEAKNIMHQLVKAAVELHRNGVFHRDIKDENVLLDWSDGELQARFIDFGCGTRAMEGHYDRFKAHPAGNGTYILLGFCCVRLTSYVCVLFIVGTRDYAPPEYIQLKRYRASPTTVWQLGVLMYGLLEGNEPFATKGSFAKGSTWI
ncbi:serine/threonine-protein kinase pim-2-like [Thalassophryne amazonica]|uniref:serine/threonine-protein kinase pim-2-like n=1 Tax=Thalassophryne amazonica TaxID=390379 RepID=UPI00147253F4|nr:serine/threonine-protein kinase pim-2-like [Thalassophryne amazonica]